MKHALDFNYWLSRFMTRKQKWKSCLPLIHPYSQSLYCKKRRRWGVTVVQGIAPPCSAMSPGRGWIPPLSCLVPGALLISRLIWSSPLSQSLHPHPTHSAFLPSSFVDWMTGSQGRFWDLEQVKRWGLGAEEGDGLCSLWIDLFRRASRPA